MAFPVRLLLILCALGFARGGIQCRDEDNNPVDWFVFYKLPKMKVAADSDVKAGKGYMFITSESIEQGWQVSSRAIDSKNSLLSGSLPFINSSSKNVMWFVYNDQGDEVCYDCGHTKGVIAGDSAGGFWLVHSIPHFINGTYPKSGLRYGQSAICLSLERKVLDSVGELLAYNKPKFREWNIAKELEGFYPNLLAAFNGTKVTSPWTLQKTLTSLDNNKFHAFAKSKEFNADLYEWVASSLQTDVLAETWRNEAQLLPSSCKLKYRVMNVQSVTIPELQLNFTSHQDHSKVAVSDLSLKPWVCVGDINRAVSQESRGGGTVCINNPKLWESYKSLIASTENCSQDYYNAKEYNDSDPFLVGYPEVILVNQ